MDTKVNYVIVGIFVVFLSAAIVIASAWISGGHHTKDYRQYITYIDETVAGLTDKAPVKFNGVDVGHVDEVSLNPKNPQQVKLLMSIDVKTPIDSSTVAFLQTQGITGYMFIALKATLPAAPPLIKKKDEPYPVIPSTASFLFQLDSAVEAISANISGVSNSIQEVFNKENQDSLRNLLKNLDNITTTIRRNSMELDTTLKAFPKLVNNLNQTLAEAKTMAQNLSSASHEAKETFKYSKGAIQDIADQTLPSAYEVLEKLKHVMENLQLLTGEMTDNPSMLVRGKVPAPSGPGE